jgi:hypothetical protein
MQLRFHGFHTVEYIVHRATDKARGNQDISNYTITSILFFKFALLW